MRIEHTVHQELKLKYDMLLQFVKEVGNPMCAALNTFEDVRKAARLLIKKIGEQESGV